MTRTQFETLGADAARLSGGTRAPSSWPAFLLVFAAACITLGLMWDLSWHDSIGRDTFWTPAHMVIYLGGVLGGCVGGWLVVEHTFAGEMTKRESSVRVFGARAPLGAWVAVWGAVAMLTAGPFDNWWHGAYGLDLRIVSPPHTVLGLGMFGICLGALLLVVSRQNRLRAGCIHALPLPVGMARCAVPVAERQRQATERITASVRFTTFVPPAGAGGDGAGGGLLVFLGGIFMSLAGVGVMDYSFPNEQHGAFFYEIIAASLLLPWLALGRAAGSWWPLLRVAAVYLLVECLMIWILPLFPAQPKLAPIYNPVTHMVPPPFPLLLIFPALAMDPGLQRAGGATGWKRLLLAGGLAAIFLAVFLPVQWFFAEFMLSPHAQNWFFAGNHVWGYSAHLGPWTTQFWRADLTARAVGLAWILAAASIWLGLALGGWMRKVRR